jgi:two-component system sensor histidine kinase KdpD
VLGHLVENAVKYSPEGSRVTVGARLDRDRAVLEVRDEGPGVPEDVDVFAPFRRGPDTDDVAGVGLGLYIVRNLCRAMGGDVWARAHPEGGSTFTVDLPAAG